MAANGFCNVRARAPLRLGLAGGGTDLSPYCDLYGGAALNVTIDRFAFASLRGGENGRVAFRADDVSMEESFEAAPDLPLDGGLILHRAVYNRMVRQFLGGNAPSLILSTTVDAPPGSGLGSSSALVVAMVEAFRGSFNLPLGPYDVAHLAFEIERIDLALAGGKQDQYAAAFGGLNFIEFLADDRVIVNPLRVSNAFLNEFESSIVVCFTGQSRNSDEIIARQISGIKSLSEETIKNLDQLKNDAVEMKQALLGGRLSEMRPLFDRSWNAKKRTASGITTAGIESIMVLAKSHGATTGKVSGAGGGGFVMLLTDPENRYRLVSALNAGGGQASPVYFTQNGAEMWITGN